MFQSNVDIQAALYNLIQAYRSGEIGKSAEETHVTLRTIVDLLERPGGPLSQLVSDRSKTPTSDSLLATELVSVEAKSAVAQSPGNNDSMQARIPPGQLESYDRPHSTNGLATEFHDSSRAHRSNQSPSALVMKPSSPNSFSPCSLRAADGRSTGKAERSESALDTTGNSWNADTIVGTMHHRIVQAHAEGGLGAVYLATDNTLNRAVALKEIKSKFVADHAAREQFLLEAQITARLTHPGIVPVYAIGAYTNGCPYYTMRFIEGQTMLEAIKQLHDRRAEVPLDAWQLELRHLVRRFVAACHAIAYAHNEGYLHRDIKPQNMMLGDYGETLVVDWGLAMRIPKRDADVKPTTDVSALPEQNQETRFHLPAIETPLAGRSIVGTPAYMSPEQTLGRVKDLDERSDIFALGCTLYEISTGEVAFGGTTRQEVTDKILSGEFSEPRTLNPSLPRPLAAICVRALGHNKQDRYPLVVDFVADLERWLDDEPPSVYRLSITERFGRWIRRHRTVAISSSIALSTILLITLVALVLVGREQRRTADALQRESQARKQALAALDTVTDETISQTLARQPELNDADKQFFQNILSQYEKLLEADQSSSSKETNVTFQRARGLQRVGTLRRQLSMLDQSESELQGALDLLSGLDQNSPEVCQALAKTHFELGLLLAAKQNLEPAAEQYDLAAKQFEKAHQISRDDSLLGQSAIARNNSANVMWRLGRKTEARAAYEDALATLPVSLARNDVKTRQRRILLLNNYAGTLKSDSETIADAVALYEEAVGLIDRGLDDASLPSDRMAIAATHSNLATVYAKTGNTTSALEHLKRSIAVQQPIVDRYPGFSTYQQQFAKTQLQLGLTMAAMKQPTAQEQLATAQRSLRALANRFPERPSYQVDLADAIEMQTRSQYGLDASVAKSKLEEAIAIRRALAEDHRADVIYIRGLLATQIRYANELRNQQLYADAVPQYEQILATLETPEIAATGLTDGQARNRALFGLADSLSQLGNYSHALEFWDQLLRFQQDPDRIDFELQRVLCLMRLSRVEAALESINSLRSDLTERKVSFEPVQHYDLACCYSVGSGVTEIPELKAKLLERSMEELTQADKLDFFKKKQMVEHARSDMDLDCLRSFAEAQPLLIRIGIVDDPK